MKRCRELALTVLAQIEITKSRVDEESFCVVITSQLILSWPLSCRSNGSPTLAIPSDLLYLWLLGKRGKVTLLLRGRPTRWRDQRVYNDPPRQHGTRPSFIEKVFEYNEHEVASADGEVRIDFSLWQRPLRG